MRGAHVRHYGGEHEAPPTTAATVSFMASLDDASLSDVERRVVEAFVRRLETELGGDLRGVWLYGSRARGESPGPESDVDLLVVTPRAGFDDLGQTIRWLDEVADAEGADPWGFSVHLYEPERVEQRRSIRSFFIQEVDRDKIVLAGEP